MLVSHTTNINYCGSSPYLKGGPSDITSMFNLTSFGGFCPVNDIPVPKICPHKLRVTLWHTFFNDHFVGHSNYASPERRPLTSIDHIVKRCWIVVQQPLIQRYTIIIHRTDHSATRTSPNCTDHIGQLKSQVDRDPPESELNARVGRRWRLLCRLPNKMLVNIHPSIPPAHHIIGSFYISPHGKQNNISAKSLRSSTSSSLRSLLYLNTTCPDTDTATQVSMTTWTSHWSSISAI